MSSPSPLARAALAGSVLALVLCGCAAPPAAPVPTPTHLALGDIDVSGSARNGIEYLDGSDALEVVVRAMRAQGAARIEGEYDRAADADAGIAAARIELRFTGTAAGYAATATLDGIAHEFRVDGTRAATRDTADGGWRCLPADAEELRRWSPLLDPVELIRSLLGDGAELAVSPPRGEPQTVDLLIGGAKGASGALTVAAAGAPLPVRLVVADDRSSAEFDYVWDASTAPELPAECAG